MKKRGRTLANKCFLCCEEEVTIDHILVHCTKVRILWDMILALVGVSCVFPLTVRETLFSWRGSFASNKRKQAWIATLLCLFWLM